jgi:hypothetical protein
MKPANDPLEKSKTFSRYAALATAVTTLITFTIAFLTPPLSGPFCHGFCFEYPYTDIAARFPRDYLWMFPAILLMLLYVILMVCIHSYASNEKKIFSQIGLSVALMAAMILIANYFVQVSVIQPSVLSGETEGIALLSQYNPHGIFIALEEIGFLLITISLFSVVPVFPSSGGLNKAFRITVISGFLLAVSSLAIISSKYGIMREYIFEVTIISIVFVEIIIASVLLERIFQKQYYST